MRQTTGFLVTMRIRWKVGAVHDTYMHEAHLRSSSTHRSWRLIGDGRYRLTTRIRSPSNMRACVPIGAVVILSVVRLTARDS